MWQIIELRRNHPILQIMTAVLGHRRRSYRIFCPDCHLIKYFDVPASDSSRRPLASSNLPVFIGATKIGMATRLNHCRSSHV
ncbi:hypothetical protein pipiens_013462 [Culex pipiens pipiens]|uniref:Uncharacterized protein n=2 Tax=Culex pipiens complex TaxID=518105 RepID=A0A904MUQ8_CULQU